MVRKLLDGYCKLLCFVIATCLAVMVVLVFTNVVLRYAFNSGITISEELARWLFVWMTFLGAIVALHEKGHLGTDMLVAKLPDAGKKFCLFVGYLLMLFTCWLVFKGTYDQVVINWTATSAAMEVSMAIFYGCGMVFAVSGAVILAHDLWRLVSGQMARDELVGVRESEEVPHGGNA